MSVDGGLHVSLRVPAFFGYRSGLRKDNVLPKCPFTVAMSGGFGGYLCRGGLLLEFWKLGRLPGGSLYHSV